MPNHNVAVIGAGPIGSLMAAYLARNQENVYLIDIKKELISAIEQKGITVTGVGDNFNARVKGTDYSTAILSEFDVDLFFVAIIKRIIIYSTPLYKNNKPF